MLWSVRETNWALGMGFWSSSHETRVCEGEVKCELVGKAFNAHWEDTGYRG